MIKRHITAQDALRMVRAQREVCPNDGFLQQLCDLNDKLHKQGHFNVKYEPPEEPVPEVLEPEGPEQNVQDPEMPDPEVKVSS